MRQITTFLGNIPTETRPSDKKLTGLLRAMYFLMLRKQNQGKIPWGLLKELSFHAYLRVPMRKMRHDF
jgi:hypothetical protein